ncbi:MAG: ABC transporter ATP-binding protein/permease [Clostridia bacterium]|nr:ABC transporter ATP-binding protein/permease [Clostridia bacterium]
MKTRFAIIRWMLSQVRPFGTSLFLVIALGAIIPLSGVGMAIASKELIDSASAGEWQKTLFCAALFIALILVQVIVQSASSVMSVRISESVSNSIRKNLVFHMTQVQWSNFSKYHSGDILTRIISDVSSVTNGIVNSLPGMLALVVQFLAAFITLLVFEPALAILAIILAPSAVLFSRFLGHRLKQLHTAIQETESEYRSFLHEILQNIPVIKAFCVEKEYSIRSGSILSKKFGLIMKRSRIQAAAGSMISLSYWISYFIAFFWGVMNLSKGIATFGTLAAFLQLVEQIQTPFFELSNTLPQFISSISSADRLRELEKLEPEKVNCPIPPLPSAGIIAENVCFYYDQSKPVLKDVSIIINRGEIVGISGASGEGKTTLILMLLSLITPQKGHIYFVDESGRRIEASADSRAMISYVPQGSSLFSGTIAENLLVGNPAATDTELEAALCSACAWEFIKDLPEGMNTKIGERGLGLSAGQAQRIAIARAMLRNVPVLILDEATSQLDIDTEIRILKSINTLDPSRTCIIISHRPEALRMCHRVVRLENQCISETRSEVTSD